MTQINRSALFTAYNAAKDLDFTDKGRLNRALGLAQRRNAQERYITTTTACSCPDAKYNHGKPCKHRTALLLRMAAE